jgi:hypothetical protein
MPAAASDAPPLIPGSRTVTDRPAAAAFHAMDRPMTPPPMMTTSRPLDAVVDLVEM